MYVVGDYILVEPFDVGVSVIELSEKAQEERVGAVGEVISVGKRAKAEGVKARVERKDKEDIPGDIVMMSQTARIGYVKLAGKTYARCKIEDIAIFYDDIHEYQAVCVCEEKLEGNKKRVANIITPQGAVFQPN